MTVATVSAIRPFSVRRVAPPHLPRVGEVRTLRPVPEVTPTRPADRVVIYQLRPDGRLDMVELAPVRRAYEVNPPRPKVGSRLDIYA